VNKKTIFSIIVAVSLTALLIFAFLVSHNKVSAPTTQQESTRQAQTNSPNFKGNEDAFKNALNLYIQKKQEGVDMSTGPCLGRVADDWVLDIAHNPRQAVDDSAENQCQDFKNGNVKHFIEFDPNGELIRSQ